MPTRGELARAIEAGTLASSFTRTARGLARLYARLGAPSAIVRPLSLPRGVPVVVVGGATLGGSGKTRVALACARELERLGVARVALVGHAYRARPGRARVVAPDDGLEEVGDEALACARAVPFPVVVGPSRQVSVDFAARALRAEAIVVDGVLQTKPERAALALLAVDAHAPWGAGEVVPAGDLRAPREALLAACDALVPVDAAPSAQSLARLRGAGIILGSEHERAPRVGVFAALGRPDRLLTALARAGVRIHAVVLAGDHGPAGRAEARACAAEIGEAERAGERDGERERERGGSVDIWVMTPKCRVHFDRLAPRPRRPVVELDDRVALPAPILADLRAIHAGARGAATEASAHPRLDPSRRSPLL